MKPATIAKLVFVLGVMVLGAFATFYLAGLVFFLMAKVNPVGQTELGTWLLYWRSYSEDPAISKRLLIALAIPAVLIYGAIGAAAVAAMRQVRLLYGEARFANPSEIANANLFGSEGIIIGKWKNRFLMFGGMQFVLLAAPTRSGKGVGIVIPNLLNWSQSVVVLDVKQENFMVTSGYRRACGHECYLFNPFSKDGTTHRYNPLGYVSNDPRHRVMDILAIGTALYPGEGKDSFFDEAARNLFLGLALLVFETEGLPRTIGEMLRQSSGKGAPVKEYLQGIIDRRNFREHADLLLEEAGDDVDEVIEVLRNELGLDRVDAEMAAEDLGEVAAGLPKAEAERIAELLTDAGAVVQLQPKMLPIEKWDGKGEPPLSQQCIEALSRFLSTSDNTLSSILASFNVPLTLWASPIFDAATADNDFDLRDVRKRRMSIYLGIPANKLAEAELILNLFFTQLINLNTDDLLGSRPELKYQCLLLMDEFAAPGRISIIDKANAYMAGYGMRLLTIIQSPGQLEAEPRKGYGRESARTLITNHACQILYTPREQRDANEYSEMLGHYTFKAMGRSRQLVGRSNVSESESDQKRPLMLPQELKEMSQREQIVNLENTKPIQCSKIAYYEDDVFLDRLRQVSPSLKALGRRKPNRDQLESAWGSGEMASPVPKIDFELYEAVAENRTREATLDDVKEGVDLSRIKMDAGAITPVEAGRELSAEEVENTVDEFFGAMFPGGLNPADDDGSEYDEDEERDFPQPEVHTPRAQPAAATSSDADGGEGQGGTIMPAGDEAEAVEAEAETLTIDTAEQVASPEIDMGELYETSDDFDDVPEFDPDFIEDESELVAEFPEPVSSNAPILDLTVLDKPDDRPRN